jgi:MFS family permease
MSSLLAGLNSRTFASLRTQRNYRLYFVGQILSFTGGWMSDTALPWLVAQRTSSAIAVGLLICCRYVPFSLFGLIAGVFADRFDNRRFLIVVELASMAIALALAILTFSGGRPLWAIYVLAFLGGAAAVFENPSRNTLTFQLVGREQLPNAVALNSGITNASRVVGPAIAGVIIATAGVTACFVVNAASFLAFFVVLLLIRTSELYPVARVEDPPKVGTAIREGLAFVWSSPLLRLVIGVSGVVSVMGFNFRTLLPILATKTLSVGAGTFGLLYASFGVGALAGALFAAGSSSSNVTRFVIGVTSFSTALLLITPLRVVWPIALLLVVTGMGFSVWTSACQAICQLAAPDHLRGRVLSLWVVVFGGLAPLGSLLAGWLASIGGTDAAFPVAGAAGLGAAVFALVRLRAMRDPASAPLADARVPV